jgi:tRNA(Ile)-lysidine synthase
MLSIRRSLVEQYLSDREQPFRVDSTNSDPRMTRNRLRHVVLPMLREQVNAQVDTAISRLVEQAVEIDQFLSQTAGALLDTALKNAEPDVCHLDIRPLAGFPKHLVREMFCELWQRQDWPRQAMGFDQWNRLVAMLQSRETITLPGRIEARFQAGPMLVLRRL